MSHHISDSVYQHTFPRHLPHSQRHDKSLSLRSPSGRSSVLEGGKSLKVLASKFNTTRQEGGQQTWGKNHSAGLKGGVCVSGSFPLFAGGGPTQTDIQRKLGRLSPPARCTHFQMLALMTADHSFSLAPEGRVSVAGPWNLDLPLDPLQSMNVWACTS